MAQTHHLKAGWGGGVYLPFCLIYGKHMGRQKLHIQLQSSNPHIYFQTKESDVNIIKGSMKNFPNSSTCSCRSWLTNSRITTLNATHFCVCIQENTAVPTQQYYNRVEKATGILTFPPHSTTSHHAGLVNLNRHHHLEMTKDAPLTNLWWSSSAQFMLSQPYTWIGQANIT